MFSTANEHRLTEIIDDEITVLKLGGSLVTQKKKPFTLDTQSVYRLASEIDSFLESKEKRQKLFLVHGGGSYAHTVAASYRSRVESLADLDYGYALISWAARELNTRVIKILLDYGIRALPLQPSLAIITKGGRLLLSRTNLIANLIRLDWIPVLYGDVILDEASNQTRIISGERVIEAIAGSFPVKRIIVLTDVKGVMKNVREPSSLVSTIDENNFAELEPYLGSSSNRDVTGGMAHKVRILLDIAKRHGVKSLITDGRTPGSLLRLLKGEITEGTLVG